MSLEADAQGAAEAQKVFISYRREDTAAHAGRLYDAMVARLGEHNVFMDVDIDPGVDFVERITEVVSSCLILIVVMGPDWATVEGENGSRRLADSDDFVRLEVETALRRSDVTPIPVLVAGAQMPKREELPEELQPLTRRNALELSDARWGYDVGRLHTTLTGLLNASGTATDMAVKSKAVRTQAPVAPLSPEPGEGAPGWRLILEGIFVAALAAVLGRLLIDIPDLSEHSDREKLVAVILRRGATWALVGAALAVWLSARTERSDTLRVGLVGLLVGALAGALGGAIWGARVFLHDPNFGVASPEANTIQLLAFAVTGGLVGGLVGWLSRPSRVGVGLAAGGLAAFGLQLALNALGWNVSSQPGNAFNFGLGAIAIVAAVLAATLWRQDRVPKKYKPACEP